MKKTYGKTLASLLAACVLAAGTFVSCGEDETEEPTAAASLAKPVGDDPFIAELYKAEITSTDTDKDGEIFEDTDTYYCALDTDKRIITVYEDKEKNLDDDSYQQKYTYDISSKTVTLAYYALAIPTDADNYLSDELEYTGGWKLVSKSDYINDYLKKSYDTYVAKLKERLDTAITEEKRKNLQKELDDMPNKWNKVVANLDKQFDEAVTYTYAKTGNVITLTNADANPKSLVLTPASN